MAIAVHCDIVSAEHAIFSGLVRLVVANATEGEVGIEYGHAPFLSSLKPGPVRVKKQNGQEEVYYVSGGYIEVQPYAVTILADTALREGEMDEEAAKLAVKQAEEVLKTSPDGLDYTKAAAQLAEATAQLRTMRAIRKKLNK